MPAADEITRHLDPDPDEDPWVDGPPPPVTVVIADYDPAWPARFEELAAAIRHLLGDTVLDLQHVGSTAVPGLAAKPVIDIDLTVPDPRDEDSYVPALVGAGWVHTVREPSWHEHRLLVRGGPEADPKANLHVFRPDCPETVRHLMFRDWLRTHDDDRKLYEQAKLAAIPGGGRVMDYNARKQDTIRAIYDRIFRAAGLI